MSVSNLLMTNPWWRTAAILKKKIEKLPYLGNGLTDCNKILHNDAN